MSDKAIAISYEGVSGEIASLGGVGTSPPGDGWIWVNQCSFRTSADYAQADSARTTMQAEIVVDFVAEVNMATIGLLRAGLTGTFDKSVVLAFLRITADGPWEEYLRLELENCGISAFGVESSDDRPGIYCILHCGQFTIMSWAIDGSTRGASARVTILNEV